MKIKYLLLLVSLSCSISVAAQKASSDTIWDVLLNDIKIKHYYSTKYNGLMPRPKFGREVKALNGQTITVRGFFLPIDVTNDMFVLSYNPMNMCFFCTGDGYQTILELNVLPKYLARFKKLKTDNYFEVRGKLRLNQNNYEHLFYILDDVEFIELIKQ